MSITFRTTYPYSLFSLQKEWEQCVLSLGQEQAKGIYSKTLLPHTKPVLLGLGITTKCNLSCLYCYYKEYKNTPFKQQELSIQALTKLLSAIPHLQNLIITLEGEPFLHSDFYSLLKIASAYCEQITLVVNANFPLNSQLENLQHTNVKQIIVSIDSPEAKEYSALRKGADFSLLCKNIKQLKKYTETIQFHSVISNKNKEHIAHLPYLAKDFGVRAISFSQVRETDFTKQNKIFPLAENELKEIIFKLGCVSKLS